MRLLGGIFCLGMLLGCQPDAPPMSTTEGAVMGTDYHVTWINPPGQDEQRIREGVFNALSDVDDTMSTYQDTSELSHLNQSAINTPLNLSPAMTYLLGMAEDIHQQSGGGYDVTVGALVNLWGFGPDHRPDAVPDPEQIRLLQAQTGQESLKLDRAGNTLVKEKPVMIDLSSIAKGYGVDKAAEYLESQGIQQYMVEVGGEIRLKGPKSNGEPWRIAVESPVGMREIYSVLSLNDAAMATSGDYRNYFEQDGVRYSHTIDPRTGRPITHNLASVSVLANNTAEADGWATAFMVLGVDAGKQLAEEKEMAVYFIFKGDHGFEDWASTAFQKRVGHVEKSE